MPVKFPAPPVKIIHALIALSLLIAGCTQNIQTTPTLLIPTSAPEALNTALPVINYNGDEPMQAGATVD